MDFFGGIYRFFGGINFDDLVDKIVDIFDHPSYDIEVPEIKLNSVEIDEQNIKIENIDDYESDFIFTDGGLLYDIYYFLATQKHIGQWLQVGDFGIPYSFKIKLHNGIEGIIKLHSNKTILLEIPRIGLFVIRNKTDLLKNLYELKNIDL